VDGSELGALKKLTLNENVLPPGCIQASSRGLLPPIRRVPVQCMEFEPAISEFPSLVKQSWQAKFAVGANSYLLIIEQCSAKPWMFGNLLDQWPHLSNIDAFYMVKFDNIINKFTGTDYECTPKNDSYKRERLRDDGLSELFSHVTTAIDTFGRQHNVLLFVACAHSRPLERMYQYLLTRVELVRYDSRQFTPANEQLHFGFARRQE
jgi:hypothetical protein